MSEWRPIDTASPKDFVTVLTIHEDDLYPQAAFRCGTEWLREMEGPEDTYDGRTGKHESLYRRPTHWMPLPEPPGLGGEE